MLHLSTKFIYETWQILLEMAPYLLLGFALAGILSVTMRQSFIEKWLGKKGLGSVIKASLLGVPLPLCSCGVIPVTSSLYQRGASKGATTSFLTSTPQTGVDSITATAGMINPFFAIVRVAVALVSGIVAGVLVDLFEKDDHKGIKHSDDPASSEKTPLVTKIKGAITYGFHTLPADIGKTLLLGIVLAGLLSTFLPEDWGNTYLQSPWLTYLAVTLIAIPLYVCSTGSIPIAFALMAAGVSPGAALVFLIAGPATNMATITTLLKLLGKRTIAIYLLTIICISWLSGWLLDNSGSTFALQLQHHHADSQISIIKLVSALALLTMLGLVFLKPVFNKLNKNKSMDQANIHRLSIEGMTCSHCAANVEKSIAALNGIISVHADASNNIVEIESEAINLDEISKAVTDAGYEFKGKV